jgi:hypothetical protein
MMAGVKKAKKTQAVTNNSLFAHRISLFFVTLHPK